MSDLLGKLSKVPSGGHGTEDDPIPLQRDLKRAGEAKGFTSREPMVRKSAKKDIGPASALNIRCPLGTNNRFVTLAQELDIPYWKVLERLMDAVGVDDNGYPPEAFARGR